MYLPRRAYDLLSEACSFDTFLYAGATIEEVKPRRHTGPTVRVRRVIVWLAVDVVHQHASTVGPVRGDRRKGHLIA